MFGLLAKQTPVTELVDAAGDGYYPDGLAPENDQLPIAYSPVTGPEMYGEPNEQLFQSGAYPYRDDGPQYSWDQGLGRSPGQQWPHMPHREQYSFDKEQAVGFGPLEDGTADLPADSNANPLLGKAERAGWAMMGPAIAGEYYAQEVHEKQWWPEPVTVENVPAIPLVGTAEVSGY